MSSNNPLSEWYGYDKLVQEPDIRVRAFDLGITTRYGDRGYPISQKAADFIKSQHSGAREYIARTYYPECDGRTDEDFSNWISKKAIAASIATWPNNWRMQEALSINYSMKNEYYFNTIIHKFFGYKRRSDRIFRIIELNHFLHYAKSDQTLKNFLETDTNYQDKCKRLEFQILSNDSKKLYESGIPKFLEFGSNCTLKVRERLLGLTLDEFKKLLTWDKNQYYSESKKDTSLNFVELFIGAALGAVEKVSLRELSPAEIKNAIMTEFFSGSKEFWNSLSAKKDIYGTMTFVLNELSQVSFIGNEFTRNLSYLIHTDVLSKLSPIEVVAIILGYHKSARWAEPNKGETTLETATKMMIDGKLDPEFFAKLVAHIIINDLALIVVDEDLCENTYEDTPISWAYELVKKSKQKRKLVHPKAIQAMM